MISLLGMPIQEDNIKGAEEAFISSLRSGLCSMPVSVWSRLYRRYAIIYLYFQHNLDAKVIISLKPYLRPPGESGEGVLDFFHQQLSFAVTLRYLTSPYNANERSPLYSATHCRVCHTHSFFFISSLSERVLFFPAGQFLPIRC